MTWKERYREAHAAWFTKQYPASSASYGTIPPIYPDTRKANGLTRFIVNFIMWSGFRATRITTAGRMIGKGNAARYIPGTTRRGTSDVSSTIAGRSVQWEIKCGPDVASEYQIREQALERKAGGEYFFTHDPDEFFQQYDSLFVSSANDSFT